MASVNKVLLFGGLTRDPEIKSTASGALIAEVGFAVTNRRKNASTGQWENEPCYVDCTAFGKTAETIGNFLKKGSQAFLEGHLSFDQWVDKATGAKRTKLKVIIDNMQMIGDRQRSDNGQQAPPQDEQSAPDFGLPAPNFWPPADPLMPPPDSDPNNIPF